MPASRGKRKARVAGRSNQVRAQLSAALQSAAQVLRPGKMAANSIGKIRLQYTATFVVDKISSVESSVMTPVYIAAARRTPVAPRNGALRAVEVQDLGKAVIQALLDDTGMKPDRVDHCIMGNALYGGGNPARVAALAAGLPPSMPAMTIDTQCCAGLDAITIGACLIATGQAQAIIAGGVESYSRSPQRSHRPTGPDQKFIPYVRPPFTPWPDADPDMIEAAAELAAAMQISRESQNKYAISSHAKACANKDRPGDEYVPIANVSIDTFARELTPELCSRLPLVAGNVETGLTSATIAVEADAAAAVLLVGEPLLTELECRFHPVRYVSGLARGGDPAQPALAPVAAAGEVLAGANVAAGDLATVEIMEAFAMQAMIFIDAFGLREDQVNRGGGGLARGHPIGASGALLAVRLFHELQREAAGACGLAAIAAAGGLGSAALFSRR